MRDSGITVIVRTMGRASLHAALASVASQAVEGVQVVIVDASGAGPITTHERPPPRWVSTGHALPRAEAAAAGLNAVRTRWALFLDDDDVLLDGHLKKLLGSVHEHPEAILAHTGVELAGDIEGRELRGTFDEAFEPWELLMGNRMPIHAALFDAERARAAGVAFDTSFEVYEDWDYWLQLAELGPFVHVSGISARYLVHAGSSAAHQVQHGDAPYWRIWDKWWPRAPRAWWNRALVQREVSGQLRAELAASMAHTQQLRQWLDEHQAQIRQAWSDLAETRHALAHEQNRAHALAVQLQTAQAQAAELAAQVSAQQARASQLLSASIHSDMQRRRLADELQAITTSTSWRWSAPLRTVEGKGRSLQRHLGRWRRAWGWTPGRSEYRRWMREVEAVQLAERRALVSPLLGAGRPSFSVLMPVFNPALPWLDEAIASLQAQSWPHWQLCIADDASTTPGVHEHLAAWAAREPRIVWTPRALNGHIAAATNDAMALAQCDWVCLMDQDDRLAPQALAELALAVHAHPEAALIYSDEDKLDARGQRFEPHFKPAFCVERLRGQNYVSHLLAMPRQRLLALGGLRDGFAGAQDHELVLRASEGLARDQVVHVPQVLYHWRCTPGSTALSDANKPEALQAMLRAVGDSLARQEPLAQAEGLPLMHWARVRYPLPVPRPSVGTLDAPGDTVLVLDEAVQPLHEAALDELLSQLMRPGVGLVGGRLVDAQGRWLDGARLRGVDGQWAPLPAAFGARWMVQDAACLGPFALLMRAELLPLWQQHGGADVSAVAGLCAAAREVGWRVLWTPFATVRRR